MGTSMNNNLHGVPKMIQHLEHVVAVELEETLQRYYKTVRFDQGSLDPELWYERFAELIPQFKGVLYSQYEFEFDIWLSCFMLCYNHTLLELKLRYLPVKTDLEFQQCIQLLMHKLQQQFCSVNFIEQLKKRGDIAAKKREGELEKYHQVTQYMHDQTLIQFFCRYHPDVVPQISILAMAQHLRAFERQLKTLTMQYGFIYQYRSVLRDCEQQQYVAVYSLAFNAKLMNGLAKAQFINLMNQLWQHSSQGDGQWMTVELIHTWEDRLIDPVCLLLRQVQNLEMEDMIQRNFSLMGGKINELVVRPKGFKLAKATIMKEFKL